VASAMNAGDLRTPEQHRVRFKAWYEKNKEKDRANGRAWYAANKEKIKKRDAERYKKNSDAIKVRVAAWRRDNTEADRAAKLAWQQKNLEKACAASAKRRAVSQKATPQWANEFFIQEMYDLARRRSASTNISWHVDHIVPLKHELVCGLHCENNLQVVTAKFNMQKQNHFWPDMP